MEIHYNFTMYCIVLYFEIICILIDNELRNLTASKLLKFIMQDLSKIETCIISWQEATNHWFTFTTEYFQEDTVDQVSLKVKPNTLLFDKYQRTVLKCINSFFSVHILNIETFISITNIPPVWKNKRWLHSITNFENLYKYCVFHYKDTANTENMRNINTALKAKVVLLSHAHKTCSQSYDWV